MSTISKSEGFCPDFLLRFLRHIRIPLSKLLEASNNANGLGYDTEKPIVSQKELYENSLMIKELVSLLKEGVELNYNQNKPVIFDIYQSNPLVRSLCHNQMDAGMVSEEDLRWLMRFEKVVFDHIGRMRLHLGDLSFHLAVSKRQLIRKVHQILHITPGRYTRILRMHKAKQSINDHSYDTLSQVSYSVGYHDPNYFSELFLKQYGVK